MAKDSPKCNRNGSVVFSVQEYGLERVGQRDARARSSPGQRQAKRLADEILEFVKTADAVRNDVMMLQGPGCMFVAHIRTANHVSYSTFIRRKPLNTCLMILNTRWVIQFEYLYTAIRFENAPTLSIG